MTSSSQNASRCWVCGGAHLVLAKRSNLSHAITSTDFLITDSHYGVTSDIFRCADCGFLQCTNLTDVVRYYEGLRVVYQLESRVHDLENSQDSEALPVAPPPVSTSAPAKSDAPSGSAAD